MKESTKQSLWASAVFLLMLICAGAIESNAVISVICLLLCIPCIIIGRLDKAVDEESENEK